MPPSLIVALRHGEKDRDADGNELPHQHGLNPLGVARARRLVTTLRPGALLPDDAADPQRFLVPHYEPGSDDVATEGHRPYQTVAPTAAAVGTTPIAPCPRDQTERLAGVTLASGVETLVICWEHDALIDWLAALAAATTITGEERPAKWKGKDFDTVWLLERTGDSYTFSIRSQAEFPPGD
jgi:broad specificity phosphatase PhoE